MLSAGLYRETNHPDQSDSGFILPSRRSPVSPDVTTILRINMKLCIAFLNRHLWKGKSCNVAVGSRNIQVIYCGTTTHSAKWFYFVS